MKYTNGSHLAIIVGSASYDVSGRLWLTIFVVVILWRLNFMLLRHLSFLFVDGCMGLLAWYAICKTWDLDSIFFLGGELVIVAAFVIVLYVRSKKEQKKEDE